MHAHEDTKKQQIAQLNHMIDTGLQQLNSGNRVSAEESYSRLKSKIED